MSKATTKSTPHGTQEWAESNVNIQTGCEHDCHYCYAKCMAIRFRRTTPESWRSPKIRLESVTKNYRRRAGRIMFPTTHDITEGNVDHCLAVLAKLLGSRNRVLVVSKPHRDVVGQMVMALSQFRDQIMFRFSIGSASSEVLRVWEPGAPSFEERLESIRLAHGARFQTSVSCEPMLDQQIDLVIEAVRPYVTDSIWIGKANRLGSILAINSRGDADMKQRAGQLMAWQSDKAITDLYRRYQGDAVIKWKESIKDVVGIQRAQEAGLDV